MKTKLEIFGTNTLGVEVSYISSLGVWILINEKEYYMPFIEFPWFRNASSEHIRNVKEVSPNHYYWEDLDIDLTLNMITNPNDYPLWYTPIPK
jgi:hypothetical protein